MRNLPSSGPSFSNKVRAAGISLLFRSTATVPNTRPEGWLWALTTLSRVRFCGKTLSKAARAARTGID
jgi:hypothetical protein